MTRIYLPKDMAALALGADRVPVPCNRRRPAAA